MTEKYFDRMELLFSNIMPCKVREARRFSDFFMQLFAKAETLRIAVGYVSVDSLMTLRKAIEDNNNLPHIELMLGGLDYMTKDLQPTSININQNQLLAAQLLAAGKSGKAVAAEVGVTEETISRWKQDTNFEIYVKKLLIEAHEAARMRLQNLVSKAVETLEKSLEDQNLPSKERFAVAVKVLEMCNMYDFKLSNRVDKLQNPFGLF
jgi:transcriptional regulator with XRE-family HTH domain